MQRKVRHNVASYPDTALRPMRHVSDTKNLFSATKHAASQLGPWAHERQIALGLSYESAMCPAVPRAIWHRVSPYFPALRSFSEDPMRGNCGTMRQANSDTTARHCPARFKYKNQF